MKAYLTSLSEYNHWANTRVLDNLEKQRVTDPQILTLMTHVIAAQYAWFARIKGEPQPSVALWGEYPLTELRKLANEIYERWKQWLDSESDPSRNLRHTNNAGAPFTNGIDQILLHVMNHGTYHRGQIAWLMRERGLQAISTDYIIYDRMRTGQIT